MIEWLIKYPPDWYADGSVQTVWSWPGYGLALVLVAAGIYWSSGFSRLRGGRLLFLPRLALAAVLLLVLAQPRLLVEIPEVSGGRLAVLLDDSQSMRLAAADGSSPAQRQAELFLSPSSPVRESLGAKFDTQVYAFGEGLKSLRPGEALRHADARSDLAGALSALAGDVDALAAVVLVSDGLGGDAMSRERLRQALLDYRAAGVPVHTLDLSTSDTAADLEVSALRLPRTALVGDRVEAEIEIRQQGLDNAQATLVLEDDGLIMHRQRLILPAGAAPLRVRQHLDFGQSGLRHISARLELADQETLGENNSAERSIDVRATPLRVLHFEGEPRFEVKFIRRAVAEDTAIDLDSLVRTAENKYFRLGVESADELAGGFPAADALFGYDVLVLGSVAAALLTPVQQRSIRDFVGRRGGGLLLLGGRNAFAEGGHQGGELAELMPVLMAGAAAGFRQRVQLEPTVLAGFDPLLAIDAAQEPAAMFARLPALTVVNPLRQAKPGARVLLQARDRDGQPLVVLAAQRYGAGRVASFAVRDSWRWQMHASVPPDDRSHENLWRQMLRDLGRSAEGRLRLRLDETRSTPGASVEVRARALTALYQPMATAVPVLRVVDPAGSIQTLTLRATTDGAGEFAASFVPRLAGRYELSAELTAPAAAGEPGVSVRAREHLDVSYAGAEHHRLAGRHGLLQEIAAQTGGRMLTVATATELPALIDVRRQGQPVLQQLPLWDLPLWLIGLMLALLIEWAWRRRRRLA